MKTIEYRVRPVTRYIITRYEDEDGNGAVSTLGEFDNRAGANRVCNALAHGEAGAIATPMPETPELRAMAWQPIETAPKETPLLLAWAGNGNQAVGGLYGGVWSLWRNGPSLDPPPTHVHPLPPPPEEG